MGMRSLFIEDIAKELKVPDKGILSRTVHEDSSSKIVLFGFARGEELSEHTSSMPALISIARGEARLLLGTRTVRAKAGSLIHMAPGLRHAVKALTPVVMLLVLIKKE